MMMDDGFRGEAGREMEDAQIQLPKPSGPNAEQTSLYPKFQTISLFPKENFDV